MELTKNEFEIMTVLWTAGRPLSRSEIKDLSVNRTWKDKSIHTLLNSLLDKGAIKEDGFVKCGKTYGRLYAANLDCEEYYSKTVFAKSGPKLLPVLFSALINSEDMTPGLLDELKTMLEERENDLD